MCSSLSWGFADYTVSSQLSFGARRDGGMTDAVNNV